jgi:hypothetical protein
VVAGALRAVVAWVRRPPPSRRVLRLGRAVERVVRVVRGATVVRGVRRIIGMLMVVWLEVMVVRLNSCGGRLQLDLKL